MEHGAGGTSPQGAHVAVIDEWDSMGQAIARGLTARGLPAVHLPVALAEVGLPSSINVLLLDGHLDESLLVGVTTAARRLHPRIRIVLLARHSGADVPLAATGASAVTSRDISLDSLAALLRSSDEVVQLRPQRPVVSRPASHEAAVLSRLSARETDVLAELVGGADTTAIAANLGISSHTVRTHVQNTLNKLGVNSRLEAVALAARGGLRSRPMARRVSDG